MYYRIVFLISAMILSAMGIAQAAPTVDQQQPLVNTEVGYLSVGGDVDQKLAQTFRVGVSGGLSGLRLPLTGCSGGELKISIVRQEDGMPTARMLRARNFVPSEISLIEIGEFQDFFFNVPLVVTSGQRLAFTIETIGEGSQCSFGTGPIGNTYAEGSAFFDARPNPPAWISQKEFPLQWQDLPFYTLMQGPSAGASEMCVAANGVALPIIRDVPACRCFEDPGALEMRCGIQHPDFFISRRIPMPMRPGKPYEQIWDFHPLTDLDGPVRIKISGAGLTDDVYFEFAPNGSNNGPERKVLKGVASERGEFSEGQVVVIYDMKDAGSEHLRVFAMDVAFSSVSSGITLVDPPPMLKKVITPKRLDVLSPEDRK